MVKDTDVIGYYVKYENGQFLNVDTRELVNTKEAATLFTDQFSADYMADEIDMRYKIITEKYLG